MPEITVYTTEPCSFCLRVKQLLTTRGLPFTEVNLAKDADGRAELVQRTGMFSFPQVVVGDEIIGGFQETVAADRSGKLRELIAA
jgi:glutaredoxin 3